LPLDTIEVPDAELFETDPLWRYFGAEVSNPTPYAQDDCVEAPCQRTNDLEPWAHD
jgi:hypothetical protein